MTLKDEQNRLNRGLLLAIAELRRKFLACGDAFHVAYGEALRAHIDSVTVIAIEDFDPVFGVYREAEGMIIEGMRDRVLYLDAPLYRRAHFLISAKQAAIELNELPSPDIYRKMAARLSMFLL